MQSAVLSVKDVAELFQLSTATIYVLVKNNEIPHKKVRGRIFFHRNVIEEWLKEPSKN